MIRSLYTRFEVLIHEVAKFGVVGVLAFVITIGLTNLLNSGFKMSWVAATAIATIIATAFAFVGNRNWAFRHRKGKGLGREGVLFFFFNGVGLLIQTGAVALNQHGLGHHDKLSNNIALILGIGVATLFRLYSYRRWVFLAIPAEPPTTERLEPEVSRTSDLSFILGRFAVAFHCFRCFCCLCSLCHSRRKESWPEPLPTGHHGPVSHTRRDHGATRRRVLAHSSESAQKWPASLRCATSLRANRTKHRPRLPVRPRVVLSDGAAWRNVSAARDW